MRYLSWSLNLLIILLLFSCVGNNTNKVKADSSKAISKNISTPAIDKWAFDKITDNIVYFKNGKSFKTNLYELKYIGQLKTINKAPYLILSGRSCDECDANICIYIHSPSDGPMKNEYEQPRYGYPGKELDLETKELVGESRMFYGDCGSDGIQEVVFFQKDIEGKKTTFSTFTVKIENGKLKESSKKIDSATYARLVPKCNELPGVTMTTEP